MSGYPAPGSRKARSLIAAGGYGTVKRLKERPPHRSGSRGASNAIVHRREPPPGQGCGVRRRRFAPVQLVSNVALQIDTRAPPTGASNHTCEDRTGEEYCGLPRRCCIVQVPGRSLSHDRDRAR
jgi:hypothetical protein